MKRTSTPPCGYSGDTEILTRGGWTALPQLTYMSEVATRSPDGRFEWQYPERITCQPYEGEMVRFHGRSLDLLVTPGHEMPYVPDARSVERRGAAGGILERGSRRTRARSGASLVAMSDWDAPDLPERLFLGVRCRSSGPEPFSVRMTGDQFAAFMGMYLAEGCTGATGSGAFVDICQMTAGKGYEEYQALLTAIHGSEPGRTLHAWRIYSRPLHEYLKPLGKALTKYVPREVLDLSRRQLQIFWDYYFLGDGNFAYQRQVISTASKAMADGLQEVVQKLGWCSSVLSQKSQPTRLVPTEGLIYKVTLCTTKYPAGHVSALPYAGIVGRVQVPNGTVYVRRGKRPVWA